MIFNYSRRSKAPRASFLWNKATKKGGAGIAIALIIALVVIVMLVVALVAYGQNFKFWGTEEKPPATTFCGGTNGLIASFVPNVPPSRVFQGDTFDIEVLLKNEGGADIKSGIVSVVLNNAGAFGLDPTPNSSTKIPSEDLPGTSKGTGCAVLGSEYVTYTGASYTGALLSEESPVALGVQVCYPYETITYTSLCAAKRPDSTLCKALGPRESVQNSGAPVWITSVNQLTSTYNSGDKIVRTGVEIKAHFSGEGLIYNSDDGCGDLQHAREAVVKSIKLGTEQYGRESIEGKYNSKTIRELCGTDKIVFNADGDGGIRCNIPISGVEDDFPVQTEITLAYKHALTLNTQVSIVPQIVT